MSLFTIDISIYWPAFSYYSFQAVLRTCCEVMLSSIST